MNWSIWCWFSIVLNLMFIFTEVHSNSRHLIIQNVIPEKIDPNLIKLEIKTSNGAILYQLKFQKTKGILANSQTPVLIYSNDFQDVESPVKFSPDNEVMQEIGNFSFYHDIDNKASAVLFSDSNGFYLDGIIGDHFRLHKFPVKYLNNVIGESDPSIQRLNENDLSTLNKTVQNTNVSYPELLVVLDYSLTTNVSKEDVIKTQLVYWNAVDMLFASMKSPEIYLNIAGFILPTKPKAFPFLAYNRQSGYVDIFDALDGLESLFYKYQDQIPFNYDILIAMTRGKLCVLPTAANPVMNCVNGYAEARPDTVNKFDNERKTVEPSIVLHFSNKVSSYTNAAQKLGFMFTGQFTQKREIKGCSGIMEEYYRRKNFSLSWSTCTQRRVNEYLQSPKGGGLKNFPKYLQPANEVQLSTTESPEPSGWSDSWKEWLFKITEDTTDGTTDIIMTTEPSIPETTTPITVTEEYLAEVTKKVSQMIDSDNQSQDLTTSEALFQENNSITTTDIIDVNVDLQQNSTLENHLEHLIDKFNTTSTLSDYFSVEPLSINYMTLDLNQYSSTSRSLDSFRDEEVEVEPLKIDSRFLEESTNTLEQVTDSFRPESENITSISVKTSTEGFPVIQDRFSFVDVTNQSEKTDITIDNQNNETKNSLVELTTNSELKQSNLSIDSDAESSINRQSRHLWITEEFTDEIQDDENTRNLEATKEYLNSYEDLYDYIQKKQTVSANEEVELKTMDVNTTPSSLWVTSLNRTSEWNDSSTELVQDNSTSVVMISSTESTASSPAPLTCKREQINVDVTLQLNINTNDKNIKSLKRKFNSSSLLDKNENATYSNDKEKVIKNLLNLILETSDN